jgi:hypothetical protein
MKMPRIIVYIMLGLPLRKVGIVNDVADANFKNRWLMAIPAFLTHACIGTPFAWSLLGDSITR